MSRTAWRMGVPASCIPVSTSGGAPGRTPTWGAGYAGPTARTPIEGVGMLQLCSPSRRQQFDTMHRVGAPRPGRQHSEELSVHTAPRDRGAEGSTLVAALRLSRELKIGDVR